jgi:hypothetical protein
VQRCVRGLIGRVRVGSGLQQLLQPGQFAGVLGALRVAVRNSLDEDLTWDGRPQARNQDQDYCRHGEQHHRQAAPRG